MNVVLVDDEGITRLNRQYFQRSRPTNVISFPQDLSLHPFLLGDVVISAETAARQARAAGEKTEDEVIFLTIHGLLHLLGFDHEGPVRERQRMEAKERELFSLVAGSAHRE